MITIRERRFNENMKQQILPCDIQNGIINIYAECEICGSTCITMEIDSDNNCLRLRCECGETEEIYF